MHKPQSASHQPCAQVLEIRSWRALQGAQHVIACRHGCPLNQLQSDLMRSRFQNAAHVSKRHDCVRMTWLRLKYGWPSYFADPPAQPCIAALFSYRRADLPTCQQNPEYWTCSHVQLYMSAMRSCEPMGQGT